MKDHQYKQKLSTKPTKKTRKLENFKLRVFDDLQKRARRQSAKEIRKYDELFWY